MKTCSDCNQAKPFDEFARQREPENRGEERTADGLNTYCKVCTKQRQQRAWYEANKPKVRAQVDQWRKDNPEARKRIGRDYARKQRWEKLGITEVEYDALMVECQNHCNGCSREFSESIYACVDHDHATGAIRGLLCGNCNRAIGLLKDRPETLDALAAYLRKHGRT